MDLEQVAQEQKELNEEQQKTLQDLLTKYEQLFDWSLGLWTGTKVNIDLKKDAQPYHSKAFPIPRCHLETLKVEVQRLCNLGVLKKVNRSQWATPTFVIPKKDGSMGFISNFRELNK